MLEAAILKCRMAAGVGIPVDKHVIDHEDIEVLNFFYNIDKEISFF